MPVRCCAVVWFQHTAARRRLVSRPFPGFLFGLVSTHSRPKAAGYGKPPRATPGKRFNTQPPEGGWLARLPVPCVSSLFQHTAARRRLGRRDTARLAKARFQHTAARRRLEACCTVFSSRKKFQHTAARRRLDVYVLRFYAAIWFQHTAARRRLAQAILILSRMRCFNTQPPEGGWTELQVYNSHLIVSTHSRPKAAGERRVVFFIKFKCFNTQPPEGGWSNEIDISS